MSIYGKEVEWEILHVKYTICLGKIVKIYILYIYIYKYMYDSCKHHFHGSGIILIINYWYLINL